MVIFLQTPLNWESALENYIIKNINIFTGDVNNSYFQNGALAVSSDKIIEAGEAAKIKSQYPGFIAIDGEGRFCMPGWINTHMHLYSTFARGLALNKAPHNFIEILEQLWWRLDKALDSESIYYSAIIPAVTAVKNGVTSIVDHHASPSAIPGSLDRIREALELIGLRANLCYEVSDRDGQEKTMQGLEENERFIKKCEIDNSSLFSASFGLHAAFTLSDETLNKAKSTADIYGKGFHLHLAEGTDDDALPEFGVSTTRRLADLGILGDKTIAAHAVHISKEDMDLLAETRTMAVHNPQSNMNNAVGRTDIFSMLQKGILAGLGTDGMSPSLIPDIRTASLIHKHDLKNPAAGWNEIRQMVFENNHQIYQRISGQKTGKLKKGYLADIILLDYYPPTPIDGANIWGHVLYGIADAQVDTTIINGRIVMKNKKIQNIDEIEIAARSREIAAQVWKEF